MRKWSVKLSGYVRHNHQSYGPGDTLPGLSDEQVAYLEAVGVVAAKEAEPEELEQPAPEAAGEPAKEPAVQSKQHARGRPGKRGE